MSEPSYRQATIHDAEAIAEIINTVVREPNPVGFDGPSTAEQARTWLTRLGSEGGIFLCLIDERAVGFSAIDFDTHQPDTAVLGVWLPRTAKKQMNGQYLVSLECLVYRASLGFQATGLSILATSS